MNEMYYSKNVYYDKNDLTPTTESNLHKNVVVLDSQAKCPYTENRKDIT